VSDSYYDIAQICMNGHVINSMSHDCPQSNQNFCDKCGEQIITSCPKCSTNIRGYHNIPELIGGLEYETPSYCFNCGESFPWTQISLEAASELADDNESLTDKEKSQLKDALPALVQGGPKTVVAESRFNKLMKKAGKDTYDGMRSILLDVVSEAVKKSIFGGY